MAAGGKFPLLGRKSAVCVGSDKNLLTLRAETPSMGPVL